MLKGIVIVFLSSVILDVTGMNEKQMQAAVKVVRNVCMPKTKATADDIDKMHQGNWDIDYTAKCYMSCSLNMYKLMHANNTFNYESAQKQLKTLPDTYLESAKMSIDNCRYAAETLDDKCIAAYEVAKCMYLTYPEKYFLP